MRALGAPRRGQTVVEYMLAIAVIAVGLAAAFMYFGKPVTDVFNNVRTTVQQPVP